MTLWQPRAGDVEISTVVRGRIERAMMDHRNESAERMLGVAAYVVTQIEKPWREKALAGGNA